MQSFTSVCFYDLEKTKIINQKEKKEKDFKKILLKYNAKAVYLVVHVADHALIHTVLQFMFTFSFGSHQQWLLPCHRPPVTHGKLV